MKKRLVRKQQTLTYKEFIEAFLRPFIAQIKTQDPIDGSDAIDAIVTFYIDYEQLKDELK
jgi:flagellar hook assembly protein FlgD